MKARVVTDAFATNSVGCLSPQGRGSSLNSRRDGRIIGTSA
jgi:hypothetical protein